MSERLYEQFLAEQALGLKADSKATLRKFVSSFGGFSEKQVWTEKFLRNTTPGERKLRIRHELYEHIVFPVLLAGYQQNDPGSLYWLAGTMLNLVNADYLHARINYESDIALLKRCYHISANSAHIRDSLLHVLIDGFRYFSHEWPSGLLYSRPEAWQEEYWEVMEDIKLARELDQSGEYANELDLLTNILVEDRVRRINEAGNS